MPRTKSSLRSAAAKARREHQLQLQEEVLSRVVCERTPQTQTRKTLIFITIMLLSCNGHFYELCLFLKGKGTGKRDFKERWERRHGKEHKLECDKSPDKKVCIVCNVNRAE